METKQVNQKGFWSKVGSVLNVCWKIALVIVGIGTMVVGFLAAREKYYDHYGESAHYYDRHLSGDICVHYCGNGNVRVYDSDKEEYTTPRLLWVAGRPLRDSLTVFIGKDEKRGFLNVNTGKIVIEPTYKHAWVFSEGLAAVVGQTGKMGFIDHSGQYVIQPTIPYFETHDYVFKHGVCCIEDSAGHQGLLGRDGSWVLPLQYDYIGYISEADMFVVTLDGKEGLVTNNTFEWFLPIEYDRIYWLDAPIGNGFILYKDFCKQHVSLDGTVLDAFVIDGTKPLMYMTKYHSDEADEYTLSEDLIGFSVYGLWGVMDKHSGRVIIPARYGSVSMASSNIIECMLDDWGYNNYVLYDLKGNKIE